MSVQVLYNLLLIFLFKNYCDDDARDREGGFPEGCFVCVYAVFSWWASAYSERERESPIVAMWTFYLRQS